MIQRREQSACREKSAIVCSLGSFCALLEMTQMTFGDTCKQEKKIKEKEKDPTPPASVSGSVPIVLGSSTVKSSYAEWLPGMQICVHVWTHTSMCTQVYTRTIDGGGVCGKWQEEMKCKGTRACSCIKYRNLQRKRVPCHT